MHMSSPVLAGDWLFGFSGQKGGHLFCLDVKTGQTLWQSEGRLGGNSSGYASLLNAGSVWLALTNSGYLIVLKASGTAYEPIAEWGSHFDQGRHDAQVLPHRPGHGQAVMPRELERPTILCH
jgi:hypothetical protein